MTLKTAERQLRYYTKLADKLRQTADASDAKKLSAPPRPLRKVRNSSRVSLLSDHGEGVERMINAIDHTEPSDALEDLSAKKLHAAEMRLFRKGLGYLVPTLRLIAKNRDNRQESIRCIQKRYASTWNAAKRLYLSHRKTLPNFFSAK